ncbi:MAG: tetratricopeptide repeat protein [Gemmataceae bacterium]|nr:tetratricopeptide repeat protein [Gemmataceae bacterium]
MSAAPPDPLSVFADALDLPETDRGAYLDAACGTDPALRAEVDELLAAHARAGDFLPARPAALLAPTTAVDPAAEHRTRDWAGDPAGPSPADLAGTVLAGRYALARPLGEGGMGSVWLAQQTAPVKRPVAVKLIKAGMDSRAVLARFEAERQALAVMDHPHIAKVLDAGATPDGRPFFVMELVEGVPITAYADAHRLTPRQRLGLFVPVCEALQHAHQKGVIHRDVKPSNVLVAEADGRPVPKVIDFGVAKAAGPGLTEQTVHTGLGVVVGTPAYMAPEQAALDNRDIDTRADVYGLGALLYELLAGSPPFARADLRKAGLLEMLRVVREEDPPRPSDRLSTADALPSLAADRGTDPGKLPGLLRSDLDWVVMKALEKDRDRRYSTALGFAADVRRYLAGEAVLAAPPSVRYRVGKFVRRNRGTVLAAGAVAAALLLGVGGAGWGLVEARRQADIARGERDAKDQALKDEEAARGRSDADKARADEERDAAREVTEFLTDMLGQADGAVQAGRGSDPNPKLTVREALDRAAAKVEKFRDRPAVEAAVRRVIGDAYLGVGASPEAAAHLERAAGLVAGLRGADAPEHLDVLRSLARAVTEPRGPKDALVLYERVLAGRERLHPADHPAVLAAVADLARLYRNAVSRPHAVELFRRVHAARLRTLGADHLDTQLAEYEFAMATDNEDRIAAALPSLERARAAHPPDPDLDGMLGGAYHRLGRHADAVPLLKAHWEALKQRYGEDNGTAQTAGSYLCAAYTALGRHAEVVAVQEGIRAARLKALGPAHPDTVGSGYCLGLAYRDAGRLADAIRVYEETLAVAGKDARPNDLGLIKDRGRLLGMLKAAGETDRAAAVRAQVAAGVAARVAAPEKPTAADPALQKDADLYQAQEVGRVAGELWRAGEPALAEPLLREALDLARGADPDGFRVAMASGVLGRVLHVQGRYEEAEPLLVESYERMKALEPRLPSGDRLLVSAAADMLVRLYQRWGKPDEVRKWRAVLAADKPKPVAPPPREVAR